MLVCLQHDVLHYMLRQQPECYGVPVDIQKFY